MLSLCTSNACPCNLVIGPVGCLRRTSPPCCNNSSLSSLNFSLVPPFINPSQPTPGLYFTYSSSFCRVLLFSLSPSSLYPVMIGVCSLPVRFWGDMDAARRTGVIGVRGERQFSCPRLGHLLKSLMGVEVPTVHFSSNCVSCSLIVGVAIEHGIWDTFWVAMEHGIWDM